MSSVDKRARGIFLSAIERSSDQWSDYADQACQGDKPLRDAVEQLLQSHRALGSFHEPTSPALQPTIGSAGSGRMAPVSIDVSQHPLIGHYKILETLGHGGMGSVYMAQQTRPIKRKVALKVIKPGMDSSEVIARFEAERQALAMMDHPNIARVLDAGTTDEGRPYFVMELVRGVAIAEFCAQKELPLRERLELFVDTCKAVQHAHQKGIIHRDLKPSNIMVTQHDGQPVVKVIDFGVAKALNQELTERTLFTQYSQMVGTPLYMAPEQAEMSGLDIDTRSDIYSLGVILYELLTGTTPFDRDTLSKLGVDGIRKLIKDHEPERPSGRISTLKAANLSTVEDRRQLDTEDFSKQLKRELDWIVMKALEKDRERRYETANSFAADIQRYLNGEAVGACPPSMFYRSRKLVQRYRTAVITMAVVMLTLAVATAVSSSWAIRAQRAVEELGRQKQIALEAAATAQENEAKAVRLVYAADIRLAAQCLADGDIRRLSDLLGKYVTTSASRDLRGLEWSYLHQFTRAENEVIESGRVGKTVVRFSPDDKYLVVGCDDGGLSFYDGQTLKLINRIDSQHGFVRGLDFSPDAETMASIGDDGIIRLWDLSKQQTVLSFRAHEKHGFRVFYIGEGQELISCGEEPDARLWDVLTGQQVGSLENHSYEVEMAAMHVSSDRMRCAFQDYYGNVHVWDVETRKTICQVDHSQHPERASLSLCARFSPDDQYIAVGTNLNRVYVCDAQTGETLKSFVGHKDAIQSLAFHPSGELLVSGDKAGVIRTWSLVDLLPKSRENERLADRYRTSFKAHSARIWSVTFSSDGERLLTASKDGKLLSWRGREQVHLEIEGAEDARAVAYNCQKREFLFVSPFDLKRWQVNGRVLSNFKPQFAERALCIAVEPSGKRCLTGHVGGIVRIWDLSSQDLESSMRIHRDTVVAMDVSEDGRMLATGCWDGTAKLWDLSSFSEIATFDLESPHCYAIAISPRNRFLACATESLAILYDLEKREAVHVLAGHQDSVKSVVFSPDGTMLATGSSDRTIRLWDTDTGACLHVLPAHVNQVNAMTFSPDGRTLIGADRSGVVSFSNVRTGRFLFQRQIAKSEILDIALSPNGRDLALAIRGDPAMVVHLMDLVQ